MEKAGSLRENNSPATDLDDVSVKNGDPKTASKSHEKPDEKQKTVDVIR